MQVGKFSESRYTKITQDNSPALSEIITKSSLPVSTNANSLTYHKCLGTDHQTNWLCCEVHLAKLAKFSFLPFIGFSDLKLALVRQSFHRCLNKRDMPK